MGRQARCCCFKILGWINGWFAKKNKAVMKTFCNICFFSPIRNKTFCKCSLLTPAVWAQWLGPPHRRLDKHIQNNSEGSIRPRFHAVFSFQNSSVKMIFCPGYLLFFLAVFGRTMSEIIGKFVSQHNLSDENIITKRFRWFLKFKIDFESQI